LALTALAAATCLCAQTPQHIALHKTRRSKNDLEIGGSLLGVPRGQTRFVTYDDLLTLPQVRYTVTDDTNFGKTVHISGVLLDELAATLSSEGSKGMVIAICDDWYEAHYTGDYLRAHHPLLVLRVNGEPPERWPLGVDGVPMGPYLISHAFYKPSFQVLKHTDEAQVPWGVVRLDFRDEREVYAPIRPIGPSANGLPVQQGYVIARQNCFRCHSRMGEGGTKSSRSWDVVARRAATDPQWFDAYVRNPKRTNPASEMAASPQYDDATLRALRAYFQPFSE
jgi:mono/diheme cytochrome c family protein